MVISASPVSDAQQNESEAICTESKRIIKAVRAALINDGGEMAVKILLSELSSISGNRATCLVLAWISGNMGAAQGSFRSIGVGEEPI